VRAVAVALIGLAAACASAPRAGGGDPAPAIRSVLDAQVEAWNRADLDGFMDGYWRSEDLVFTSGGHVQRGWQTTLDRYRASYGNSPETMGRLSFSDLEIHPLADGAAWALGRWRLDYEGRDPLGGIFSLVFRRVDGRWLIVHDHTSSDP
jgi:ketosteroid isomerase-like protein